MSFESIFVQCANFLQKHITPTIIFYDLFKPNIIDIKSRIDNLYYIFVLFKIDFQTVKKTITPNLTPMQKKTKEINFKIFENTLKFFEIDVEKYYVMANERLDQKNKLLSYYELIDVWKMVMKFYTKQFGTVNYSSSIMNIVNQINSWKKIKTLEVKNRIWLLYLFLENEEMSNIRTDVDLEMMSEEDDEELEEDGDFVSNILVEA